jgi:hypothetical protein
MLQHRQRIACFRSKYSTAVHQTRYLERVNRPGGEHFPSISLYLRGLSASFCTFPGIDRSASPGKNNGIV